MEKSPSASSSRPQWPASNTQRQAQNSLDPQGRSTPLPADDPPRLHHLFADLLDRQLRGPMSNRPFDELAHVALTLLASPCPRCSLLQYRTHYPHVGYCAQCSGPCSSATCWDAAHFDPAIPTTVILPLEEDVLAYEEAHRPANILKCRNPGKHIDGSDDELSLIHPSPVRH